MGVWGRAMKKGGGGGVRDEGFGESVQCSVLGVVGFEVGDRLSINIK